MANVFFGPGANVFIIKIFKAFGVHHDTKKKKPNTKKEKQHFLIEFLYTGIILSSINKKKKNVYNFLW